MPKYLMASCLRSAWRQLLPKPPAFRYPRRAVLVASFQWVCYSTRAAPGKELE